MLGKLGGWTASKEREEAGGPARMHTLRSASQRVEKEENGKDRSEVDRILDKISESGYNSLSEEEKRILYEASRK